MLSLVLSILSLFLPFFLDLMLLFFIAYPVYVSLLVPYPIHSFWAMLMAVEGIYCINPNIFCNAPATFCHTC